ncbi:vacuolar ATPase assembly integral membrane protein VMA21 homolog [Coccinella septempunctata]|uniref:vacuolar ATPase assembly integral membrane protein VMA21 homolog n=1 Tax=Coccinella septempunctata TaxID=41139 RepID=UPI001D08DBD4|nr:vacuolar ATPase assembly integral membrane protein VMA21 homolog [Coccinella septempunctata]
MADQEVLKVFKNVLFYISFILIAPISTFFGSKSIIFQGIFGVDSVASNIWSAVFAVVVLHLALGMYIYRAYFDSEPPKPDVKID